MDEKRLTLWKKVYDTAYRAWYTELLIVGLFATWTFVNDIVAFGAAITAGGSAVSGWAFWEQPGWKTAWMLIAGAATLASVATTHLGIGYVLKDLEKARTKHLDLRSKCKTLLDRIDLGLPLDQAERMYFELESLQKEADKSFQPGFVIRPTTRIKKSAQKKVNDELGSYQRR